MCTHLKNSIKESCKNRQLSREPFLVISCTLHHVDAPWTMYRGMSVCVGVLAGCLQMALAYIYIYDSGGDLLEIFRRILRFRVR